MNKKEIPLYLVIAFVGIGIIGGIIVGMILQQMVMTTVLVRVGESLEGITFNVEVDLNETELISGFNQTMQQVIPMMGEMLNNSIKENKSK